MDDTAQTTQQNDQQVVMPQDQPVVQQPTTIPAGKESAPISIPKPPEQWVQETAPQAKIEEELQEAGIEAIKGEVLEVHPDAAQAGVTPTGVAAPIPTEPTLKLPLTEEKARAEVKHKKFRLSITWLAALVLRQIKQMQFKKKPH